MANIYNDRTRINGLFGQIGVSRTDGTVTLVNNDQNVDDFIYRDPTIVSLQREIMNADITSNMKLNPRAYIRSKNNDLVKIARRTTQHFKSKFLQYLEYGYTQKEAEVRAKKDADQEEANLMMMHRSIFPKDISQLNLDITL